MAITYQHLGHPQWGRLGNQLWELAGTIGLAKFHNDVPSFPSNWAYKNIFNLPNSYFRDRRGIEAWRLARHTKDPYYCRFLQDYGLWKEHEDLIREYLKPNEKLEKLLQTNFSNFLAIENKIAIHVRRTDYLAMSQYFPTCTEEYYNKGLSYLPKGNIIIFSDDPDWCSNTLSYLNPVYVSKNNPDYIDLFLMSFCDYHVIANSTFSWWGAFLSRNPSPIYPKIWWGDELAAKVDYKYMIPDGWLGI